MTDPDRSYIPAGFTPITPYLCCRNAAEAIDWYIDIFGAVETGARFVDPDGRVGHAGLRIDGAELMLSDGHPELGVFAPEDGHYTYALQLYVPDATTTFARAEAAGATVERPLAEQFHGSLGGVLRDPFGVRWFVATQLREVPAEEMDSAAEEYGRPD